MASVSAPARPRPASAPPAPSATVRHGKCSLHLSIGGTRYRLTPLTPPAGYKALWSLHKQAPEASAIYQVAVEKGQQPACTCPDHEINGAVCKHVGALKALGLIPGRKARPAAARRSHARRLAESPAPSAPARGPVATGYARATRAAIAALVAAPEAEPEPEGFLCAFCGEAFDPQISRDPHFCGPCAEEGSYK